MTNTSQMYTRLLAVMSLLASGCAAFGVVQQTSKPRKVSPYTLSEPISLLIRQPESKLMASHAATVVSQKKRSKFKNFDEMLKTLGDQPILIDFHASWCGPCRIVQKELEHVRDKIGDKLHVFNIDTERFPSLGTRFQIAALPTLLLFKDGEVIHRIVGVETADEIMRQVGDFI